MYKRQPIILYQGRFLFHGRLFCRIFLGKRVRLYFIKLLLKKRQPQGHVGAQLGRRAQQCQSRRFVACQHLVQMAAEHCRAPSPTRLSGHRGRLRYSYRRYWPDVYKRQLQSMRRFSPDLRSVVPSVCVRILPSAVVTVTLKMCIRDRHYASQSSLHGV